LPVTRNKSKSKKIKPVASRKGVKIKKKKTVKVAISRKTNSQKKKVNVSKAKMKVVSTKSKLTVKDAKLSVNSAKLTVKKSEERKGVKVVSDEKKISDEHLKELEHLHRILSDAYVRQMLIEIGGENALEIVRHFYGSHSDEELAKKLSLRISDVRATLNKLHNKGLVYYAREKDSETGWYSYSWSLNKDRIVRWVSECAGKGSQAGCENGNDYYICPTCGIGSIIGFEAASEKEFRCHRCNKSLEFVEEERFSAINQLMRKL